MPVPGHGNLPIQFTPMALNLYYQLSANSIAHNNPSYDEQLMMSVAMKALHDYPIINESTAIEYFDKSVPPQKQSADLLPVGERKDNKFRFSISLLPITYNEAIQFWTAEESPMKLSAYYELSVVFLEPAPPVSLPGRVLAYGVNVFTEGAPQIIGSQNFIEFKIPNTVETQQLKVQPAQVAARDPLNPNVKPLNILSFLGTGFNGTPLDLLIVNGKWSESGIVPLNDPNWQMKVKAGSELSVEVQETIKLASGATAVVLPGLYAAQIRVTKRFKLPNGNDKDVQHISNQFPFTVTPRIDTVSGVVAGKVTVTGFVFQDALLPKTEVQIYVGNQLYTEDIGGAAGRFVISNATTLIVTLVTGLKSGDYLPLRVLISGAESAPNWIKIP